MLKSWSTSFNAEALPALSQTRATEPGADYLHKVAIKQCPCYRLMPGEGTIDPALTE
jgi:hypothetical protein